MNPTDPNQPQIPTPVPVPEIIPVPAPIAPNPFGGTPVSSVPVPANPFAQTVPIIGTAPAATIGSSPNSDPIPSFVKSGKTKKLIILIAAIVGSLIVLGVIGLVVVGLLFPSKADYRDASTQFNTVSSAYSTLNSNASKLGDDVGGSTTDTVYTNDSDSVTKSLQTFQDANKKLAAMKAIRVGDGQKLYASYAGKVNSYSTYATNLLVSLKNFRPITKSCSDISTATLLNECVTALNSVGDIPDADLKQFVTVLQTQYKVYQDLKTQLSAISDPYGKQYAQYSALRDQAYSAQDKISSAATDYSSNSSKHANDNDPSTAANALGDFLVKKANG